jgi:hypothetical protein
VTNSDGWRLLVAFALVGIFLVVFAVGLNAKEDARDQRNLACAQLIIESHSAHWPIDSKARQICGNQ